MLLSALAVTDDGRELDRYIEKTVQGDKEALAELYRRTHTAVYGFALSLCRNVQDAEDVLQDVYIRVYQAAGSFTPQGKPLAWLFTITRHLALMRLRERGKTDMISPEDWQTAFADATAVTSDDRLLLQAVLSRLSDEERQIVLLHAVAGMKHREIAALLDHPLPTVLSKYNRALKKLKNAIQEDGDA